MKKFFLLIPAMLLTLAINAAVININTETSDALRVALASAADGDEIVMAAGTYVESNSNYIAFAGKHVTVKAAEGANVLIQPKVPVTITAGGCAHFKNVKFDVSKITELADWYSHLIYPEDDNTSNSMILEGCEIYGFTLNSSLLYCSSSKRLASVTINNCYFHNIKKSCLFIESTTGTNVSISNSTFANIETNTDSYSAGVIDTRATAGSFSVDHCTFYNCKVINTDYGTIGKVATPGAVVSNCIFAMPESTADLRAIRDVATANNSLTYNYTKDSGKGIHGDVTKNNCIFADPLLTDPANGDFSYPANWVTMSISPARYAGTDGSDLGDPRWYSAEILPSTNFSTTYDLLGNKAKLSGRIELNASDKIHYKHNSETADGTAKWKLHVGKSCIISALADVEAECTSGRQLTLTVKDADGNTVAILAQPSATYNDADINLGQVVFAEEGDYTFILTNSLLNSGVVLEKITLTYEGGAVQNIATDANTTLNVADAWFTSGATRAEGQISYSSWNSEDSWVKWNIATSETKFYDLTLNFSSTNAHSMAVNIYEDEEASPVATVSESFTETTGTLTLTDRVNLVGGKNYIVKVTNPTSGSQAKVTSVLFAPVEATATELPGTLAFSNAVLSDKANITDGMLYFNEPGADKDPRGQWAQWEVTTDHDGLFLFTMGVASANEQSYKITILDNLENVLDFSESNPGSGNKTIKHYFPLNTGSYFVKVENTRSFSKGHLTSFEVTEPESASIITLDETATDNTSWSAKVNDGNSYDVQIIRTIKAGMYNTICLPFEVTSEQAQAIFGTDVQLRTLESATVEAGDFVLNLNFTSTSSMYQGTPHLIKTSRDIVNPIFTGVKFTRATPAATTKTNADFVGTFIKDEIPADPNNLFMGANNTLYFPTVNMPILGMRAYFVIHNVPAGAVKRARIIENEQVATEIELVMEQPNANSQKLIENGQLIIIRDDVRYNVMGVKLQ